VQEELMTEGTRILVVEDDRITADYIRTTLLNFGYSVTSIAATGEDAVRKALADIPDLVLMDILLKGEMDGIEAAGIILSRRSIPIVYLTAHTDATTLERAKKTEPYGYIAKPFDQQDLSSTIEIALHKHKAEEALRSSREWLAVTLRSIGEGVIVTDRDGRIQFMNPIAETLTGCSLQEGIGRPVQSVFRLVEEDTERPVEDPVTRVIREGGVSRLVDRTLLAAKDGARRPIMESGAPIRDREGDLIGVVLVIHDVAEKKKMAEEQIRAQRLESLGTLAGGIAHDFNNLLTGVLGNIALAKIKTQCGDERFQILDDAEQAAVRARDLTCQLLTFARGGAPVKKTTSIADVIQSACEFVRERSGVTFEYCPPPDLPAAEVDAGQFDQVIRNLLVNAAEAMPAGGTVRIGCEEVTIGVEAAVSVLKAGRFLKITIRDEGVGIPGKNLPRIFDPYFTTKEKGTGLGLTAAYSIVRRHDGLITAESGPGGGAAFHIYLPVSSEGPPSQTERHAEIVPGRGKILVMDDEELVRNAMGGMIRHLGYEVHFANDGADAVRRYREARESGSPFDLVIMDLMVPGGMGGREALRKVLEIDPRAKAVAASGYSGDSAMAEWEKHGFCGVVVKPPDINELSVLLSAIVNKASR
jgi:two-component system cell cycle sensor histidine kinase/response regulator CckA